MRYVSKRKLEFLRRNERGTQINELYIFTQLCLNVYFVRRRLQLTLRYLLEGQVCPQAHLRLGEVEREREVQALAHGQVAGRLEFVLERDELLVRERRARAPCLQGGRCRRTRAARAVACAPVSVSRCCNAAIARGVACFAARR